VCRADRQFPPEALRSGPIYHAEGLKDPLLMPRGLVDQNVQVPDIFRLTRRLIGLGEESWGLTLHRWRGTALRSTPTGRTSTAAS